MKKILLGIALGALAGIIDVVPMIMQNLTWDANLSAFAMWVVVGFLLSVIDLKIPPVLKGIIVAFLVLLPTAILIGWKEPQSLIPIVIITVVLSGVLGFTADKFSKKIS